ncbi:sulfatase family protein [Ruania halotolerans]|uniref:sulfatase family protein n=1 Tax=Ruania halotolerans TaxID=2897773 RepID=UPI001E3AF64F|nr:sulfatase-like hydrolase/transferase [Ruania halotolerans]UFU07808.1 sulfatase-like hydrolase/transferase [Ruania halotolerans]
MTRPNILLISTDQQRWDALGASGNPHITTPHLDRLAAQGARFTNCYVQSSVCAPSRASLMTSRYLHNHGVWANGVDINPDEQLFTRALTDAGYDCGLVGKFHLGAAQHHRVEPRVDDGFRVFRWSHDPYVRSEANHYHTWLEKTFPGVLDDAMARGGAAAIDTLPTEQHYSRWIGEETIEYLTTGREKDKPFCFVVNFFDPHHGFGSPPEYRGRYDAQALPGPIHSDLSTKPAIYSEASKKSYAGASRGFAEHTDSEIQDIIAHYYAMVTLVDDEVGRILDTLEAEGLAEDTIVIFTSDHGEMLGDHQMLLKGPMMFDCSVRVPLLVRWPSRIQPETVRDELVEWIDLAPTLLAAAGVDAMPRQQGRDLAPLWRTEDAGEAYRDSNEGSGSAADTSAWEDRNWVLSEYRNSCWPYDPPVHTTMLRQGDWKIVVHHGPPSTARAREGELYDLANDPHEQVNLWNAPEADGTRLELERMLLDVLVATEDRSQRRLSEF